MSTFYKRDGCNGSPAVMRRLVGGDSHPIAVGMNDCKDEELIAMSAAPELLEALQACEERMTELQKYTNFPLAWPRIMARDAIAKATGGAA